MTRYLESDMNTPGPNRPRSSTSAGACPDPASTEGDSANEPVARYTPPDASTRRDPTAAAATLRQFTAWG